MLNRLSLFVVLFLSVFCSRCFASDIAFTLNVVAKEDQVRVSFRNTGTHSTPSTRVTVELAGEVYDSGPLGPLQPGGQGQALFTVKFPSEPGTYPLITRLLYDNDGQAISVINAGYFNYRTRRTLKVGRGINDLVLRKHRTLFVPREGGHRLTLVLPNEVRVSEREEDEQGIYFTLENSLEGFSLNSPYYAVYQTNPEDKPQGTSIVSARLTTQKVEKQDSVLPSWIYLFGMIFGLSAVFLITSRFDADEAALTATQIALVRWAFSVFIVSGLYSAFYFGYLVPEALLPHVEGLKFRGTAVGRYLLIVLRTLLEWLYFDGGNYDYFAKYVADPLYAYMLFGNYFVLRWLIKPDPKTDKYWHLMRTVTSLGRGSEKDVFWSKYSKVAVLTLMVKAFYVPLLTSWMVNDIYHQGNLTRAFRWDFVYIQSYIVAGLILIDVSVFAFGYLVELPQLKNQIRSVEPTLLGWVVCIMCYPPFNSFTFIPFDKPLNATWAPPSEFERYFALCAIAFLWAIYCWATLALGPKASNLTNRGTVDTGPYAYIRHPAYVSKVSLWIISSWFLGEKYFFLILALIVVYALRAWTEERHLSMDPDYRAYKKKVPWKIMPRVF